MTREELEPGTSVAVFAFQRWRIGRVVRVSRKRALVEYLTPKGAKRKREAWFSFDALRDTPPVERKRAHAFGSGRGSTEPGNPADRERACVPSPSTEKGA